MKYIRKIFETNVKKSEKTDIYRDNNYIVVEVFSHKASCKYGAFTRWCISTPSDSIAWDAGHDNGARVIIIINKTYKPDEELAGKLVELNEKYQEGNTTPEEDDEYYELMSTTEAQDLSKIAIVLGDDSHTEIWDANNINLTDVYSLGFSYLPIGSAVINAIDNYLYDKNNEQFKTMKKHIYTTLNEYRNQLEIPFDGKHPLHDKPTYIHVLDSLIRISKPVDLDKYNTKTREEDIQTYWDANYEGAFDLFLDDDSSRYEAYEADISDYFSTEYPPLEYPQYYDFEVNTYIENNKNASNIDIYKEFRLYQDIKDHLSADGLELLDDVVVRRDALQPIFENNLEESGALNSIQKNLNSNGLVSIWRAITYELNDINKDTYEKTLEFNSVGEYWSYTLEGAYPHSGGDGETYILHAYVKPEYINWEQTIFKSAYNLRDEEEVELVRGGEVVIYKITTATDYTALPLKKHILVNV